MSLCPSPEREGTLSASGSPGMCSMRTHPLASPDDPHTQSGGTRPEFADPRASRHQSPCCHLILNADFLIQHEARIGDTNDKPERMRRQDCHSRLGDMVPILTC